MSLLERLASEILVYDGAMGTMLQKTDLLKPGAAPEALNLTHPDAITAIHKEYLAAGADIIETNTFGGMRLKLKQFGLEAKFKEINAAAVRMARTAVGKTGYVAASSGPLEQMIEPLGPIGFDEAVAYYREWVEVVANEKPDLILFETFSDIYELKAAIIAAREVTRDIPIQTQLTYEEGKQTVSGTPPAVAAVTLSALDVQIIGTNCSTGPEDLVRVVHEYYQYSDKYISVLPNAGLPELREGKMVFKATPEHFSSFATSFIDSGAAIIGGCCGTTPEHIRAVKKAVRGVKPLPRIVPKQLLLSSRTQPFAYDEARRPFVIGERINPTGKKMLSQELVEGKTLLIRTYALEQTRKGAHLLDVNVGAGGCDEKTMMKKAVRAVQAVSALPLVIDSADPDILEIGLRAAEGKVLINSVNGEEKNISRVLGLAKKYGAAVLVLTTDENGIPKNKKERLAIVARVAREAADVYHIPSSDIVVDPLTLTVASEAGQASETLNALAEIKKKYGFLTSLGVSNISFGLPHREHVNAEFLSLSVAYGLDFAIANPNDKILMGVVKSGARSEATQENIEKFVKEALNVNIKIPEWKDVIPSSEEIKEVKTLDIAKRLLYDDILYGNKEAVVSHIKTTLDLKQITPDKINTEVLIPALEEVGRRFEAKEFFLPHVIMAAEAMQFAFECLKKHMTVAESREKGKIVFATVEGDFHDIGKNIVIAVLEGYGYGIVDLGKNIPADQIIEAALREKADIVALSALMTTTMIKMQDVIEKIKAAGIKTKTMVGGAVLTDVYAKKIGAHGYAKNAIEAVSCVKSLLSVS